MHIAIVDGKAHGQGSKRIVTPKRRVGMRDVPTRSHLIENDPELHPWRDRISAAMRRDRPAEPVNDPVTVYLAIYQLRPASHYGVKGLKPSAETIPSSGAADIDKIQRAIGDAGQGIWWRNDRRIACWKVARFYADDGRGERIMVGFREAVEGDLFGVAVQLQLGEKSK